MAQGGRPTRLMPGTTPPPVTDPTTTTSVTSAQLQAMIDEGVTAVLAARATTQNGDDSHTSGTGVRRNERTVRECTYQDFMKCQPLFFRGTEGVVNLTQWFERMETVFRISNCTVENQVKFATCTLMGTALTWWNSHARTVTNEVAYAMTWSDLKKKMTTKYCPRNEIKKIEVELWNLKVQGTDVVAYNQRFQELALLSDRMFPEETDKIERYVGGMPDSIYSSVVASKPKTMQEAIEMATELMERRINTLAEKQTENKRKLEDTPRNNQTQQPNKRQNTGRAYAAGNGDRRPYEGAKPRCPKCNFNHYGPCHFKKDCPQWKNKNQGNGNAVAKAYAVGVAGQNPDNNVVTDNLLLHLYTGTLSIGPNRNEKLADQLTKLSDKALYRPIRHHVELPVSNSSRIKIGSILMSIDYREQNKLTKKQENKESLKIILSDMKKEDSKIESVKDWASPQTPTEIRQFLGLAEYNRRFIERMEKQILNAQTKAQKPKNIKNEDVGGMLIENAKFPKRLRSSNHRSIDSPITLRKNIQHNAKDVSAARDRQKSNADFEVKPMEFEVGEKGSSVRHEGVLREDVQQYGLAIPATMLNNEIIQLESYKMFILYSTGQIPSKKSRGKGVKKKATISVDDNIIPESDIALELGKSVSLTKAEEEAAAREVHDTHARIVIESVPEPARTIRPSVTPPNWVAVE
ncbi:putative reverse transcriptase domain-containing protein [Tanacetum coccineum]